MASVGHYEGIKTTVGMEDGNLHYGVSQDVQPILEYAHHRNVEGFHGTSEMKHAARIPFVVVEKYCHDHNIEFHEFMANKEHIKRVVNDPSLKAFRIWPGRV